MDLMVQQLLAGLRVAGGFNEACGQHNKTIRLVDDVNKASMICMVCNACAVIA
jgi:hypothetical protein